MATTGTAHFVSKRDALRYYRNQDAYNMQDIDEMLEVGEIRIGPPECDPSKHQIVVIDGGTRYGLKDLER